MRMLFAGILLGLSSMVCLPANAVLTIEITQGEDSGVPIAVVPFRWHGAGNPPEDLRGIIAANLHRSGRFDLLPPGNFLSRPSEIGEVRYKDWRLIKAEALVVGRIFEKSPDNYEITFQLLDVYRETQKAGYRFNATGEHLRQVAHQISDHIYHKLTGIEGAFDTRIAYVTREQQDNGDRIYQLMVADSDGHRPQQILRTTNLPVLSPAWSPDGEWLAYVSFVDRRSGANVWLQNIRTGNRRKIAQSEGAASAPAWSPDGKRLALRMSHKGNADIYLMDVASGSIKRLTRHPAIDTEPAWAPNGRQLVFTSDRSGRPQIYRVAAAGGKPERLTRGVGRENARASYDPKGERLVMVTNRGTGYQIGVFYMADGRMDLLTDGTLDESPVFAPNGAMVLYATRLGREGVLAAVSADGRVKQVLKLHRGEVREPSWAPKKN